MQNIIKLKKKIERNFDHKLKYNKSVIGMSDYLYDGITYSYKDIVFICTKCNYGVIFYQNNKKYTVRMPQYNSSYKSKLSCSEVIIKSIIE